MKSQLLPKLIIELTWNLGCNVIFLDVPKWNMAISGLHPQTLCFTSIAMCFSHLLFCLYWGHKSGKLCVCSLTIKNNHNVFDHSSKFMYLRDQQDNDKS